MFYMNPCGVDALAAFLEQVDTALLCEQTLLPQNSAQD